MKTDWAWADWAWAEVSEAGMRLPPGACATCGGEGQEQFDNEAGEPDARTCLDCNGSGAAPKEVKQ